MLPVLASDGLWDTHTNEEAVALVGAIAVILTTPCRCPRSSGTVCEERGGWRRRPTIEEVWTM